MECVFKVVEFVVHIYIYVCVCVCVCVYTYIHTGNFLHVLEL